MLENSACNWYDLKLMDSEMLCCRFGLLRSSFDKLCRLMWTNTVVEKYF